jgi:hypothetical protein
MHEGERIVMESRMSCAQQWMLPSQQIAVAAGPPTEHGPGGTARATLTAAKRASRRTLLCTSSSRSAASQPPKPPATGRAW